MNTNAIADSIRNGGTVEYMGETNPLQTQWLRIVDVQAACRLLAAVGDSGIEDIPLNGVGAVVKLITQELSAISYALDNTNAEICRAINGEPPFKEKGV